MTPTGESPICALNCSTIWATTLAQAFGVDFFGVGIRIRLPVSAGRQIDGGALDARSADVDAQDVVRGRSHASHARAWTGSRSGEADVNKGLRPKLAG